MDQNHLVLTLSQVPCKNPDFIARSIAGELMLVPLRRAAADPMSIFTLNETAAFTWEHIDGNRTLQEISSLVTRHFQVSEQEASQDLLELAGQFQAVGAILFP